MNNPREDLARAIGKPFTTRRRLAEVLGYKNAQPVDKYLKGLPRINKTRYYTYDVVDAILKGGLE